MNTTALVAACQFDILFNDVTGNLNRAQQLAFEAAAKGARVIVLPELCVSGYALKTPAAAALLSQHKNGFQTQMFVPVASHFNCHIIFGYVEIEDGLLYNSAACVGPTGLLGNFRKHNLQGRDYLWATPGETLHSVIPTTEGRLGILVGRDVMNQYRQSHPFFQGGRPFYKKGSVDVIALPSNWLKMQEYPPTEWVELAESTGTNVIVANRVGREVEAEFGGGSLVVDRKLVVWTNGSSFSDTAVVGGVII
jgi:predicted amidohydrolase